MEFSWIMEAIGALTCFYSEFELPKNGAAPALGDLLLLGSEW
jgi:hypothetical protein